MFFTADIVEVVVTCFRFRTGNKNQLIKKAMDEKKREKQNSQKKTKNERKKTKKIETSVRSHRMFFKLHKRSGCIPKNKKKPIKKTLNQNKKIIYHLKNDKKIHPKKPC